MSDDRPNSPTEAQRARIEQAESNARTTIDDLRSGRIRVDTARDVRQAAERAIQDNSASASINRMSYIHSATRKDPTP